MTAIRTPLTDKELDRLSDFLESVESDTTMNIEELDGFFCALVVGLELVMPSVYWPHILGGVPSELTAFETQQAPVPALHSRGTETASLCLYSHQFNLQLDHSFPGFIEC